MDITINFKDTEVYEITLSKDSEGNFVISAVYELECTQDKKWDRKRIQITEFTALQKQKIEKIFEFVKNKIEQKITDEYNQ